MTDDNRTPPDPDDDPTTVTRWPPFGQPGEHAPTVDETQTQWVAADQPAVDNVAEPATGPPGQGGWFPPAQAPTSSPAPPDEPQWADWDHPWQQPDEPFDQAALPPDQDQDQDEPAREPVPAVEVDPPAKPEPRAPSEYVSPYPTTLPATEPATEPTDGPGWHQASTPEPEQPNGPVATRTASLANLHYLRVLAQVACPILLFVGLTFSEDHAERGWKAYTAWACFAMVCAILQLAPLVGRSLGITTENAWFLAAVGTAGLVGYWVIIVLPGVSSNTGFAQTLAAAFAVIGLWLSPGRRG